MAREARNPRLARSAALLVALVCFVASQAVWAVPLRAWTECSPSHPQHSQMSHDMAAMGAHECCPQMSGAAHCTHPVVISMAGCAQSQRCCRIEQEHRIPKPTSSLGADNSQASHQPHLLTMSRSSEHRPPIVAAALPHPRPVLDQKSDLRI